MFIRYLFAATLFAASTVLIAAPAQDKDGMLVDSEGMTLYTYDKDSEGISTCHSTCAENWPPLEAMAGETGSGKWSVVTREDGISQWSYKGKPLYTYARDMEPGDRDGEGKGGVWHVAKP
ncbi:putative lipoprotein with Yx(FWY)xxD motif [Pseudomonas duriflava]|uniref:Putative lipoprotein with Yx(FWY)xxD motif n=1 Tax=Pseudomonas duriflava TaxID=459528 RepID=A0A562QNN8_9PSED|nr:hypothetical protein [Pseudomonas duriflava]TWI58347.1 putative lipoprotein with Yx(FWY)xxD motif [Pseudomonas duriflava]